MYNIELVNMTMMNLTVTAEAEGVVPLPRLPPAGSRLVV